MSEQNATQTVRTHVLALPGNVHVQRIEDKLSPGVPDMNVCWEDIEFWLEGKFVKELPKRDDTLVRFGPKGDMRLVQQANWLRQRQLAGGRVFWWVRVADVGWYLFRSRFHFLHDGIEKQLMLREHCFASAKDMVQAIAGDLRP